MIPALAFNDRAVKEVLTIESANLDRQTLGADHWQFRPAGDVSIFQYKANHLKINNLRISAIAHSPLHAQKVRNGPSSILIPIKGNVKTHAHGNDYLFQPQGNGFLSTHHTQNFETSARSVVRIELNEKEIASAYEAISGTRHLFSTSLASRPLPLQIGGVDFSALFQNLFQNIDLLETNEAWLSRLNIDDSVYRLCACLLKPEGFLDDATYHQEHFNLRPEITKLCDFLSAHLSAPISLTQMEQMSGLSARVLQRSFQKAFGLRPKQWVRKQRLHAARSALLNPHAPTTITSVAYDFCFASPSDFARHYLVEFGEPPSQTLMRK